MSVRAFALVYGIVFLLVGICGFIPAFLTHPAAHGDHGLRVNAFEGYLFGLFHVNVLHSLVHVPGVLVWVHYGRRIHLLPYTSMSSPPMFSVCTRFAPST